MRLFVAVVLAFGSFAAEKSGGDINLLKSDGKKVQIPTSGRLADPTAQSIARDIAAYDKQAAARPTRNRTDSPELRRLRQELRDETVDNLALTYRLADSTSGPLDTTLLQAAKKSADLLKQVMSAPPPPNPNVHTEISVSLSNAVLHYCLRGDYRRNACSWRSYSAGDVLPIGLYIFRANATGGQTIEEEVLVLDDPTRRSIQATP